jgi:hypothetical protein
MDAMKGSGTPARSHWVTKHLGRMENQAGAHCPSLLCPFLKAFRPDGNVWFREQPAISRQLRQQGRQPRVQRYEPIVIIGAGGIVRDAHLPACAKAGMQVIGITALDANRRKSLAKDQRITIGYAFVTATVVDHSTKAVYDVTVPQQAITSAPADYAAVLIQKPMGADLA